MLPIDSQKLENQKRQLENEKKRLEMVQAYKRLFMTDDGKKVLGNLEGYCGFNRTSFFEQNPDALRISFNEGKRDVYLWINGFLRKEENE